ncbi:transglycosylase domain-containing protein [Haloferula sp. A504]|uniref:transglycosylase domain-containing protein n=1 Tax=Haloferula sp. A504 TaxID=3373601 RepID=UPI0031BF917F|nr:penicillin-binding protein [Verrucomicrobiaceae bacterium E54]
MSTWRPVSRFPRWLSWLPDWLYEPLRWLIRALIVFAVVFAAIAFYYLMKAADYDIEKVAELPSRTTIVDRNGVPIEVGWGASRHLARRQDLPEFLVSSLEAREDARFFTHHGVDFRGLARATLRNIKDRDFTQGASTLTMQLARNTYDMRAKSIHRKLLEIALTLRIESRYTKDEILTHYLNRIYFGAGCHGIEEAARTYFGKSVSDLHEGECAMLIGIIRGPHIFSPSRNLKGARDQQDEVLQRLIAMGRIDEAEGKRIRELPIRIIPDEQQSPDRSYALQMVRDELSTILEANDIRSDGLIVHTTLERGWQLRLESDLSKVLLEAEKSRSWEHPRHAEHEPGSDPAYVQCAAVTLDSDSGEVLAWIGGRDFLDSRFDRATGARRDLGTAVEPWIATAAAERDKRVLPGRPLLTGRQIGPLETARIARRCGLGGPFLETEDLFRGSAAATPAETATALATLANGGKRPVPYFVSLVTDADGKELYRRKPDLSQAVTRHAATNALELFHDRGSGRCFQGFTGSERDAWLLRVGPSGSTAIWIGFDDPAPIASGARVKKLLDELASRLGS